MPDVTLNGVTYSDGPYEGLCAREKAKRPYDGVVSLTGTGRIVAAGPCEACYTLITKVLYTP